VEAILVRSKYSAPINDIDGHSYEMKAVRVLRGSIGSSFQVWEENSSGRASFDWKIGHSYLLFLQSQNFRGGWQIDGCGNSGPLPAQQQSLEKIQAIDPTSQRALISGAVWGPRGGSEPLRRVQIEASGPNGVLTAQTNDEGRFALHVTPGKYQVRVVEEDRTFVPEDLSYERPDGVVLENSGCAQIQFVEVKK
jgi:hypothetical protein